MPQTKAPPPPAQGRKPQPSPAVSQPEPVDPNRFVVTSGRIDSPQRVVIYGPGGIGKTSLAALCPNPVFLDIEGGTKEMDVQRIEGIATWADLRACLQSSALDGFKTVVIDSATKAEELAIAHTIAHVPHEKGTRVSSIEGYGFGKGYQHVYDTFLHLLAELDTQVRAGRNVVLVAHDCTADVPNPAGEDFIRYEPHFQSPKSGKASIRNRVVQWADHVLFVGYDVAVNEQGKGIGSGTRTIWPVERPTHLAKSRILREPMEFTNEEDGRVWSLIHGEEV